MVALPRSTEEISKILVLANDEEMPVFPRGAGTGTTGASVPAQGGLALAFTRMNRILSVSTADLSAEVEPGVVTGDLQDTVSRLGLFYPPDPASLRFCTIGGNVSTGAGGPRAVKYGVTRDYVTTLELVLPGGDVLQTGRKTAKSVVGYDLTRLIVGSEGTLGVVSGITLRLIPAPEEIGTLLAFFASTSSATDAIVALFESKIIPRCAEFLDRMSIECISHTLPVPVPEKTNAMLLIEIDGARTSIAPGLETVSTCCETAAATGVYVARTEDEAEALWTARRGLSPAIRRLGFPDKISEDICVPRHALPDAVQEVERIGRRNELTVLTFGHAGDGNLHVNVLLDRGNPSERNRGETAVREIMEATLALGGTISGEHGIGLTKQAFMPMEVAPRGLEIMKAIKRAFDPNNIMNPGKMFPCG
jgi:glycolate oxidase